MESPSELPAKPKASLSKEGLTYGVELEFVIAFHQDELELELAQHNNNVQYSIKKNLSYFAREAELFTPIPSLALPNHAYHSWGLSRICPSTYQEIIVPYSMEPMKIVGRKLRQRYPGFRFKVENALYENEKTKDKYSEWMVTSDHSVCGVGSENIPIRLGRNDIRDVENWDSYGIEAVSRVLNSHSSTDKEEIAKVVEGVKGNGSGSYGAFITNQCGMHIHVQAPQELDVLKELALVLIVYEQEISRLHPPCRRPNHPAVQMLAESNRMGIMDHRFDLATKHFDPSTDALEKKYNGPIEAIRRKLRNIPDMKALAKYMNAPATYKCRQGNRNRQVNFISTIRGANFATTIEFRQARGSLCPQEICRWADFCVGLVKISRLYWEDPTRFRVKGLGEYHDENGNLQRGRISVFDLMQDMELGDKAIEYWKSRMAKYASGMKGDADDQTDNEMPPPEPSIFDSDDNEEGDGEV